MNETFAKAEQLAGHVKEYVNTKIELAKLSIAEKSSQVIANLVAGFIVAIVFIFFLVFASVAAAYALSEWIGKTYAGFLIISGCYLVIGMLVWAGRIRLIQIPIMNSIIRQLFNNESPDEKN
jgi:Fe2+ transport system protein B